MINIVDRKAFIEERTKPLSDEHQRVYYVYEAYVDSVLRYIGKGKGSRWKHCISGNSSCGELNRDFYSGKKVEVFKRQEGLMESEAEYLESSLISENRDKGIYNKTAYNDLGSKPNVERMKDVKIVGAGGDKATIKHLCKLSPEIAKYGFDVLRRNLDSCGLSLYLVQAGNSAPMLVLDKPKISNYEVTHLGCKNWPNCDVAGGCGEW